MANIILNSEINYRFSAMSWNSDSFFCRKGKADPQIRMELQWVPSSQTVILKKEQSWKTHTSQFQNLPQSLQ